MHLMRRSLYLLIVVVITVCALMIGCTGKGTSSSSGGGKGSGTGEICARCNDASDCLDGLSCRPFSDGYRRCWSSGYSCGGLGGPTGY